MSKLEIRLRLIIKIQPPMCCLKCRQNTNFFVLNLSVFVFLTVYVKQYYYGWVNMAAMKIGKLLEVRSYVFSNLQIVFINVDLLQNLNTCLSSNQGITVLSSNHLLKFESSFCGLIFVFLHVFPHPS